MNTFMNHFQSRIVRKVPAFLVLAALAVFALSSLTWADAPAAVPATGTSASAPATGAPGQAAVQPVQSAGSMLVPILLMFGVVYFLMLRPQQKKMKEQQEMLKALQHGDEVVTSSGFLGTVTGITDKVVTLEIGENVRVKMLKNQISQVIKGSIKDLA